jgi:protein-tyrosine phosphatase
MPVILNVDHVVDGVYISGVRQAGLKVPALLEAGIVHVLKLYPPAGSWPWPAEFTVCDNPISDRLEIAQPQLRVGVDFVADQVAAARPVLVCCEYGISRSATFVLAYLVERGYSLHDAWKLLRERHNHASPDQALWGSLIKHYHLNHTIDEIYGWYEK